VGGPDRRRVYGVAPVGVDVAFGAGLQGGPGLDHLGIGQVPSESETARAAPVEVLVRLVLRPVCRGHGFFRGVLDTAVAPSYEPAPAQSPDQKSVAPKPEMEG
jgi:hypothetical protein